MKFESIQKETVMLNPKKDMARKVIPSEIRKDPLTGRTARICHFMKLQWQKPDFDAIVAGTDQWCPFCPDKIRQVTPCFPDDIAPEGRMEQNGMMLVPNIAPYDCISAVTVMGPKHYLPMTEIGPDLISGAFGLSMEFFRRVREIGHPESAYQMINWNYMPASGSSIIHPHLQVFSSSTAPYLMKQELDAARGYVEANQSNFWEDFVRQETEDGRRFLARIGRTSWFTTFAPMGVAGDVLAVVDDVSRTSELTDDDLSDLADGLVKAMKAYDKMGIYNFNMNFFTGGPNDDQNRFHLVFSPRAFFNQALGTPDIGALRNLYNETICMAYPEEIRDMLKPDF